jgi:two-component system OmpR family response regulator
MKRILVVDDDTAVATMLARALARHGFEIDTARTGDEALTKAAASAYDAAVLDLVMPGRDGADLSGLISARHPGLTIAFLTGYAHSPLIEAAKRAGRAVFTKPVVVQELVDFLRAELG